MSTRTDQARRLELSSVEESGDVVTGRAKGLVVRLEGEPPFSACVVELGVALPIAHLVMQLGDLNHADAVETGDAEFDESMQVIALPRHAPTMEKVLADGGLRAELLEFFKRYPGAGLTGPNLRVPSDGAVSPRLISDALAVAEALNSRFAAVGFLETESPAQVPASGDWIELLLRAGAGLLLGGVVFCSLALWIGLQMDSVGVGLGVVSVAGGVVSMILAPKPDRKK